MNPELECNRVAWLSLKKLIAHLKEHNNTMLSYSDMMSILDPNDEHEAEDFFGTDIWEFMESSDLQDAQDYSISEQWENTVYGFIVDDDIICFDTCESEGNGLEVENVYLGRKVPKEDYCLQKIPPREFN